jgi:tetratricopeptide (TPR) repeat protein
MSKLLVKNFQANYWEILLNKKILFLTAINTVVFNCCLCLPILANQFHQNATVFTSEDNFFLLAQNRPKRNRTNRVYPNNPPVNVDDQNTDNKTETTPTTEPLLPPDQFTPNPLLVDTVDPLLPNIASGESLSVKEKEVLTVELDKLYLEANTTLQAGNRILAWSIWNRELRLRRYLGTEAELIALQRVATIAWNEGNTLQIQWMTQRVEEIEAELATTDERDLQLLSSVGLTYQALRARNQTLAIYQQILEIAREKNNLVLMEESLQNIGKTYAYWLNYRKAATTYEELLEFQQQNRDALPVPTVLPGMMPPPPREINTLQELAFFYEQAEQPLQAIAAKERLAEYYLSQQNLAEIPTIKIAIADYYQTLGKLNLASQYYQEAYSVAQVIQQYHSASEALEKLGDLYLSQNNNNTALQIFQVKLVIDQQFSNVFGLLNAYDKIGQIQASLANKSEATAAFQKGLQLSQQLGGYRSDYFVQKLEKLQRQDEEPEKLPEEEKQP